MISHAESPNNWTTYYSDNDVKIEYQYTNCEYSDRFNQEFVILKMTNLTNNNLSISWVNESWYDKKCINCNDDKDGESFNEVLINSNQVVVGDRLSIYNLIFTVFNNSLSIPLKMGQTFFQQTN